MSAKSGKLQVPDEAIYAKDVHGFVVLWVIFYFGYHFVMNLCDLFTPILQGCFRVHFDFRLASERTRVQSLTVPVAFPGVYRKRR